MIPLSNWVKSRSNSEDFSNPETEPHFVPEVTVETHQEVAGLADALLDNLMTSQTFGLRATVRSAGQTWSEQVTARQDSRLTTELLQIENRLVDAVTKNLLPVLADIKLKEVISEFSATLKKLLPELAAEEITVMSPSDLADPLYESLSQHGVEARIVPSEQDELSMKSGHVVLTAELSAWREKLNEALHT